MEPDPYWQSDAPAAGMPSTNYAPPGAAADEGSRPGLVATGFRVINVGLCAMMAATGVLSLMGFGSVNENQLSGAVLSLYLLLFSATWRAAASPPRSPPPDVSFRPSATPPPRASAPRAGASAPRAGASAPPEDASGRGRAPRRFSFEASQVRPCDAVVVQLKRNFGFLFHPLGKSSFIIFCAFLNFGVQASTLGLATGILCIADGVLLILLYLKWPHLYPG